jgi:hypothetical protein
VVAVRLFAGHTASKMLVSLSLSGAIVQVDAEATGAVTSLQV